jgi:hypothetical protein
MIDFLVGQGLRVNIETISGKTGGIERLGAHNTIEAHRSFDYDFIVSCTHNGNPSMCRFQDSVVPRLGTYDIEHDLFHDAPEHSPLYQACGVLTFTRSHDGYIERQRLPDHRARWYKMDQMQPHPEIVRAAAGKWPFNPGADAVLIGSDLIDREKGFPKQFAYHFHTVWYKPYSAHEPACRNTARLGGPFTDAAGTGLLSQCSRYWFTVESSCFVEALCWDCLPILWNDRVLREQVVDEFLSRVVILCDTPTPETQREVLAFTTKDFNRKFGAIWKDYRIAFDLIARLKEEYLGLDYASRPKAHEVLWRSMRAQIERSHDDGSGHLSRRVRPQARRRFA